MDYPRHVHQPGGRYLIVADADAHAEATTHGWTLQPDPVWVPAYVRVYDVTDPVADPTPPIADPVDSPAPAKRRKGRAS